MVEESSIRPTGADATATVPRRHAIIVVFLTIALCAAVSLVAQPHITHWLSVRDAFSRLRHPDGSEKNNGFQWLIQNGQNPDDELVAMLDDPSVPLRLFAANKLGSRPAKREITDALLRLFADNQYLKQIDNVHDRGDFCNDAIRGLDQHAITNQGKVTATDEQIIALLRPMLTDTNQLHFAAAQVLAEYLPRRPELREPLTPYLTLDFLYGNMKVARGFYRADPTYLDTYLDLLVKGAASDFFDRQRAFEYLGEFKSEGCRVAPRLRELRSQHPKLAAEIDRTLAVICPDGAAGQAAMNAGQ